MKFPTAHMRVKGSKGFAAHRDSNVTWTTGGDGRPQNVTEHATVSKAKKWMHECVTAGS